MRREELSDAYSHITYMHVKGRKIPVYAYKNGQYLVDSSWPKWRDVMEMREHDRGWWVGEIAEDKVDDVFAVNEHYPVGSGWRDRPAPEWIEPVPYEREVSS